MGKKLRGTDIQRVGQVCGIAIMRYELIKYAFPPRLSERMNLYVVDAASNPLICMISTRVDS